MTLTAVLHLLAVHCHQAVEERVKLVVRVLLRSHYSPHSLHLLTAGLVVHAQLDAHIRAGQIDSGIADSAQEKDVNLFRCLE